jgi:hypothetical protein
VDDACPSLLFRFGWVVWLVLVDGSLAELVGLVVVDVDAERLAAFSEGVGAADPLVGDPPPMVRVKKGVEGFEVLAGEHREVCVPTSRGGIVGHSQPTLLQLEDAAVPSGRADFGVVVQGPVMGVGFGVAGKPIDGGGGTEECLVRFLDVREIHVLGECPIRHVHCVSSAFSGVYAGEDMPVALGRGTEQAV